MPPACGYRRAELKTAPFPKLIFSLEFTVNCKHLHSHGLLEYLSFFLETRLLILITALLQSHVHQE